MTTHGSDRHPPHHVHLDEADGEAAVARTEREGELLIAFVTDTAHWIAELRGPEAPPVRRVLDIGSGPGVGTCELARVFPDAQVVAVDGSPAMLDRTTERAASRGLGERITTHGAELPGGLDGIAPADVVWASMSLHHIGDETRALRELRALVAPSGLRRGGGRDPCAPPRCPRTAAGRGSPPVQQANPLVRRHRAPARQCPSADLPRCCPAGRRGGLAVDVVRTTPSGAARQVRVRARPGPRQRSSSDDEYTYAPTAERPDDPRRGCA